MAAPLTVSTDEMDGLDSGRPFRRLQHSLGAAG